jgi:hypothetical protein
VYNYVNFKKFIYYFLGFFGTLKKRFRLLDNGVLYHSPLFVEDAFKAATTLHNLCLIFDGRAHFDRQWENVQWEDIHPDEEEKDEDDILESPAPNISGVSVESNDYSQEENKEVAEVRVIDPMSSKRSFKVLLFIYAISY